MLFTRESLNCLLNCNQPASTATSTTLGQLQWLESFCLPHAFYFFSLHSLSLSQSLVDGFYCWQKRSTRWARKLNHFRCQLSLPKNSDATAGSKWNRIEMNRIESLKRSLRFSSQEQPMDAAVRSILNCQSINVHWLIDKTVQGTRRRGGRGSTVCMSQANKTELSTHFSVHLMIFMATVAENRWKSKGKSWDNVQRRGFMV